MAFVFLYLILFVTAGCLFYIEEQNNFHLVSPKTAYRSAQLDKGELEYYVSKYKIKSIVNLRGKCPDQKWYREEKEVSRALGLEHYDVALSAYNEPTSEQIDRLITIFKKTALPVLLHCRGGADRAGLASAVWKVIVDNEPKSVAQRQLSIVYGHFSFGRAGVLDEFFETWKPGPVS
jgi:undecaprenyl-diphosphatase